MNYYEKLREKYYTLFPEDKKLEFVVYEYHGKQSNGLSKVKGKEQLKHLTLQMILRMLRMSARTYSHLKPSYEKMHEKENYNYFDLMFPQYWEKIFGGEKVNSITLDLSKEPQGWDEGTLKAIWDLIT